MWLTILLFLVGLGLIIKGGDFFVGASVEIARRTGLPRMVVGGTIVSLATTTPELTVSVMSSIEGSPGLAVGNAVGSVIVNLGLIVALVAIMRPIRINRREFGWPSSVMLIAGIVLFILTINLELGRWQGALLSAGGIAYIGVSYYRNRNWQGEAGNLDATPVQASTKDVDIHPPGKSGGWIALYFLAGLGMVIGGSNLLVNAGITVAGALGVPEMVVGLTMVALGTSLPELVTAITSLHKKVADLSLGNLVGANILNMTLVVGVAGSIQPFGLERSVQAYSFPFMLAIVVAMTMLGRRGGLGRGSGVILMGVYATYIVGLIVFSF